MCISHNLSQVTEYITNYLDCSTSNMQGSQLGNNLERKFCFFPILHQRRCFSAAVIAKYETLFGKNRRMNGNSLMVKLVVTKKLWKPPSP